ncbi:MAG: SMC-Scp complex subunit ScpB [Rubellimicrobium sp.]|nr:SMC-Scp complex subunit ScpB [Rubellimicrobium sp.]
MADLDTELTDLPQPLRWREWMARVEAVLFAAAEPVSRDMLARVVGRDCALDLLIADIAAELADRPYEIARTAGGRQFRTRSRHAEAVRAARGDPGSPRDLTPTEALEDAGLLRPGREGEPDLPIARESD